jgi:hypothetical protein
MKVLGFLLGFFLTTNGDESCINPLYINNQCLQFSVTSGTGCAWMCTIVQIN